MFLLHKSECCHYARMPLYNQSEWSISSQLFVLLFFAFSSALMHYTNPWIIIINTSTAMLFKCMLKFICMLNPWQTSTALKRKMPYFCKCFLGGGRWCAELELTSSARVNLPYVKSGKKAKPVPWMRTELRNLSKGLSAFFVELEDCTVRAMPLKQINPLKPWRAFSYMLARGRCLD